MTEAKAAYNRERARLRREADSLERHIRANHEARMRREYFPWEEERAIDIARKLGQESNRMNTRPKGIENYLK